MEKILRTYDAATVKSSLAALTRAKTFSRFVGGPRAASKYTGNIISGDGGSGFAANLRWEKSTKPQYCTKKGVLHEQS
jgi:hypothetical protein